MSESHGCIRVPSHFTPDPRCTSRADILPGVEKRCWFFAGHLGPHTFVSDIDAGGDFMVSKWGANRNAKNFVFTKQDQLTENKPPKQENS